jgi:hypothetical protein
MIYLYNDSTAKKMSQLWLTKDSGVRKIDRFLSQELENQQMEVRDLWSEMGSE